MDDRVKFKSPVTQHSVYIGSKKSSVSMEKVFWDTLKDIAAYQGTTVKDLIKKIDIDRRIKRLNNLSSAVRVYVLEFVKSHETL